MKMILSIILDQWKVIENVKSMDGNITLLLCNDDSGCFVEDGVKRVDGERPSKGCGSSWGKSRLQLKLVSGKGMNTNGGTKEIYKRVEQG